jgi:uncharacterized repeat protein (TIGR03806 family)
MAGAAAEGELPREGFEKSDQSDASPLPGRLSETGVFADLPSLATRPGMIRYELNLPFWSDGATKSRWIAIPAGQAIEFSREGEWRFPAGTMFVKHFESRSDEARTRHAQRLETRVLWCDASGNVRGGSYRWRADLSDADLVEKGRVEHITIGEGSDRKDLSWYFPGVEDCRECHLPGAGGVLGVNTRQLNRTLDASTKGAVEQLAAWKELGLLKGFDPSPRDQLPRLPRLDSESVDLESRARAYLDANCGFCHRPGGAVADFDARFSTPLRDQRLVGFRARINLGRDGAMLVAPNDASRSMLLVRMQMLGETGMPPLAHQSIDAAGVRLVRDWIESLPGEPTLAPPEIVSTRSPGGTEFHVVLRHEDPEAQIRYTLDGNTPRSTSPVYTAPIAVAPPATLRARAYRTGWNRSIDVHETFVTGL